MTTSTKKKVYLTVGLLIVAAVITGRQMAAGLRGIYKYIASFEGYREKQTNGDAVAYPDPGYGWDVPTIGYGTTHYPGGAKVKKGDRISKAEAEYYLQHETELKRNEIRQKSKRSLSKNQLDALTSLAYNIGRTALFNSDLWEMLQAGQPLQKVALQFDRFVYSNGVKLSGLVKRRAQEKALFLS